MQVCRESRSLVLSNYKQIKISLARKTPSLYYVNPRKDIVYIPGCGQADYTPVEPLLVEARHLAVRLLQRNAASEYDFVPLIKNLSKCPRLETLTLALHHDGCRYLTDRSSRTFNHQPSICFLDPPDDCSSTTGLTASQLAIREFRFDMRWYKGRHPELQGMEGS